MIIDNSINWAKLTAQNRVKAPGIPWTPEELKAIQGGISPDDVRAGILNKEEEGEYEADPLRKLMRMKKDDLLKKAKKVGIEVADPKAVAKDTLITLIMQRESIKKEDEPEKPAEE